MLSLYVCLLTAFLDFNIPEFNYVFYNTVGECSNP